MDCFGDIFECRSDHRIILCRVCQFAVVPNQVKTHLSKHHPRLLLQQRVEIVTKVQSLPDLAHEECQVVYPKPKAASIDGLPVYHDGLRCMARNTRGKRCRYVCRTIQGIHEHCKDEHGWVNAQKRGGNVRVKKTHSSNRLWRSNVVCQRFFKVGKWQRYFEVNANTSTASTRKEADLKHHFFRQQELGMQQLKEDEADAANRVQGFEDHRSAVVPWLRTTGIVDHVHGLKKDEISAAIALPSDEDKDFVLQAVLQEMESTLRQAHSWCFDGPECMLTWPCRVVLSRFQSSQVEAIGSTRAFDPRKEASTLRTYFRLAKQFLAYFDRVATSRDYHFSANPEEENHRPEDVIELTAEQLTTWHSIRRLAQHRETHADATSEDDLKEKIVELWMLLVSHNTGARRYRSPLLSFCAMLSIRPSTASWMEPGNFNSHLSAIIWVVQLLIFYDSARRELRGDGETLQLVKGRCERCLQQTVDTPMGEILRWRLLLFQISKDSVGTHQATWDEQEETLKYEGTELHMDDIPTLLVSEYRECRRKLYEDLMFGTKRFHHMHAWALKDNMDVNTVGWNFHQHRDNAALLKGSDQILLSTIEQSEHLCRVFTVESSRGQGGLAWRESALASYEAVAQEFLKRLAVLVHIEGGPPLRESELFSVTWRNTQRRRSICIHLERVMVHTTYDKSQQQRGSFRDNIRFLSQPVADLLLDYLVYVIPLRQILLRHLSPGALLSPYLWAKDGKVWPDNKLTRCLEGASDRARIPRLHISNWRQMTVAIVKTKFAAHLGCFEIDPDDEDAEEIEDDIRILTKLRNHKIRTANRAYANQTGANFGNVWDGLIRMGLRASTLWQDFWGLSITLRDRKRPLADTDAPRPTKRIAMGVYRPRKPWSAEALLGGMRKLYGNEQVEWKSVEQERVLTLIMSWTEQVVAILPTGAGKSLLFMLPCTLPEAAVTILLVPLVSLRCDLLRRLAELHIEHLVWTPGERREAALVMVTVEAASTKDFRSYAQALIDQQKLDRIVVDECHLTVTAVSYRESMIDLATIRSLRTQFVYLTATLPPSIQAEFEERNYLCRPKVIRASSNRANIFYAVLKAKKGKGSLLQQAAAEAQRAWNRPDLLEKSHDKIILYVQTRDEARELAGILGCATYTAKSGSAEEKSEMLAGWIKSPDQPYIVATAAIAEGFDYPHIRLVININEPESIILFAQESGRAGRDGKPAYSVVLLPSKWQPSSESGEEPDSMQLPATRDMGLGRQRERRAMHKYLQAKRCFRTSLSEHLDGPNQRRWCMASDVPCDFCKVAHEEAIPARTHDKSESLYTGLDVIQRARLADHSELARYREDLVAVRGTCLLCRALGEQWEHDFSSCHRRHDVFRERELVRRQLEGRGRRWLQPYTACFWCLNPQSVCHRADPEAQGRGERCEDGDIVLPLCYGVFHSVGGRQWLQERFGRQFLDASSFFIWLGEESRFGGGRAVQAIRVAVEALTDYHLY